MVDLVEAGIAGYATVEQPLAEVTAVVPAATDGELQCSARVNTTGMAPGVYKATLTFQTDSGRQPNHGGASATRS